MSYCMTSIGGKLSEVKYQRVLSKSAVLRWQVGSSAHVPHFNTEMQ